MKGKNSAYTKLHNRRRILGILRQSPSSRAELSRKLGLTRAAISLIADEMIGEGLIRESSQQTSISGPGRTPTLLKICENAYYAVGVSLRRSGCMIGIEDLAGRLLCSETVFLSGDFSAVECLDVIASQIEAMLGRHGIAADRLLGIGVSAPGPVNSVDGIILNPPDFDRWENVPVCSILLERLHIPLFLENDANAAALYNFFEYDFPGKENFVLLYVDCGVGSGVVSCGRLLRSKDGFTCELGHTSIDFRGPKCSCGNYGCLEMYAAIDRLTAEFGYDSWEALMGSCDRGTALDREADYLAAAVVNIANVFGLETVLLGGRLREVGDELLQRISVRTQRRTLCPSPVHFLPALEHEESYIRSACSIVFYRFLDV